MQVGVGEDFHNAHNPHITYSINVARLNKEILTKNGIVNLHKWHTNTDENDPNQLRLSLEEGILKTLEFKYPKSTINSKNLTWLLTL